MRSTTDVDNRSFLLNTVCDANVSFNLNSSKKGFALILKDEITTEKIAMIG